MSEDQITSNAIESTQTAVADAPIEQVAPIAEPVKPRNGFWWGTGRRKTAVARVRIRAGKGAFLINGRQVDVHFTEMRDRNDVTAPLAVTKTEGSLDVFVKVHGGGFTGQAGAVQLGLARALKGYDATLEPILRDNEMLTRDDRKVERKKPGQPGARKRFQFSKR
jgi:small subunit ribosomal protein S9